MGNIKNALRKFMDLTILLGIKMSFGCMLHLLNCDGYIYEKHKTSVCYVVTCTAIAVCRTSTVDGPWRVAVCVSPHPPLVMQREKNCL